MKNKIAVCMLIFLSGCLTQEATTPLQYSEYQKIESQRWICNNKDSIHHNKACHEDCFEEGNPFKYCWLLEESECLEEEKSDNLNQLCQIFE